MHSQWWIYIAVDHLIVKTEVPCHYSLSVEIPRRYCYENRQRNENINYYGTVRKQMLIQHTLSKI